LYHGIMRKKRYLSSFTAACLAFVLIVSMGCGKSAAPPKEEVASRNITFEEISLPLEVKKMQADGRGVLWILTHEKEMYTLDPDLYLSSLSVCGEGIEDFTLGGVGERDGLAAGYVYLAAGRQGLLRMDRSGRRTPLLEGDTMISTSADSSGFICAGGGEGLYVSKGGEWENLRGMDGEALGTPFRMVRSTQGILCEVWDNQLELQVPGQSGNRPLEVPGEKSTRVIELLRMPAGDVYLVTSQGVYRFEGEEFKLVAWSEDPIMSATLYGQVDILLGKNSGDISLLSPGSGKEETLGSIGEPVQHLSSSTPGLLYVQSGGNIYFSRGLFFEPSRLTHKARWEVDAGSAGPVSIKLPLPLSEYLAPEWFYYAVRSGAGELSWEVDGESPDKADLLLQGSPGTIDVEALAIASPADTFRFERGDSMPFPAVFSEEVQPYLLPGRGISLDLPELQSILDGIPPEVRTDMLSLLYYLIKQDGLFYQAPYDTTASRPPSPDSPAAEGFARQAASRVLRGDGGDDYARALALTSLCRKAGMPARMALSFDHFFNQVYIAGTGWTPVDVSHPVYDFQAPCYPAAGPLTGGEDSFITGTGGSDDDLRVAECQPLPEGTVTGGPPQARTIIVCRPCPYRLPDETEAIPLSGTERFYFRERGGEVLLVRSSSRGEEEVRIYQDQDPFALSEDLEVGLYLGDNGYVVVEGPAGL
jgi:hypothetical protein